MTTSSTLHRLWVQLPKAAPFWLAAALAPFVVLWIFTLVAYVASPIYADHAEATITTITQQWMHGRPLYHTTGSPHLYSVLYGPACFLSLRCWLQAIPDPVLAGKLSGAFWALLFTFSLFYACWKRFGVTAAMVAIGVAITTFYAFQLNLVLLSTIWNRPDTILIASVSLGLAALAPGKKAGAAVVLVLSLAFAANSKIHGFLYLLPVWAVWLQRHGLRSLLAILLVGGLLSMVPFLFQGISLGEYVTWLRMGAVHSLKGGNLVVNISAFLLLLVPVAFSARAFQYNGSWRRLDEASLLLLAVVGAGLLVCIPASKPGAGPTHLVPFAPYIGYLVALALASEQGRREPRWGLALALVWLVLGAPSAVIKTYHVWVESRGKAALEADRDLRDLLTRYDPADLQMGTGEPATYPSTLCAPRIYKFGAPRVADPASCMDMKLSGLSLAPLQNSLRKKEFRRWLIPRGDQPFAMISWYDASPLFENSARQALLENYTVVESTGSWDVYQAKPTP